MKDLRECNCDGRWPNGERACEPTCPDRFWDPERSWRARWDANMEEQRRMFPTLAEEYR